MENNALLSVHNLRTYFFQEESTVRAVDGVSFDVGYGQALGIVGESGCGKSVTALSILRLVPAPPGEIVEGSVLFKGHDLLKVSIRQIRKIRGRDISMIFQEPMTSLNPVFTVGNQISEVLMLHQGLSKKEARQRSIAILEDIRIPDSHIRVGEYPHQMSGGMQQRVMIAMALACNPSLLIADEPTTALDVTIQAQILDLLKEMQQDRHMALILITHDLGIVASMVEQVCVMYAGRIVEHAEVGELFSSPRHPYTIGLLNSLPRIDRPTDKLTCIEGKVPSPAELPSGCPFHPRCSQVKEECRGREPELREISKGHKVACYLYER